MPPGSYIVTASTRHKANLLHTSERLDHFNEVLFQTADEFGWMLEAWAIFANHYHLIANSTPTSGTLKALLKKLHAVSSIYLNKQDGTPGRQCWFQYFDTQLTFEKSYLARLNYVHNNPVRHGLVSDARSYKWCSAQWFFLRADKPFYETVSSFKIDQVNVWDDF